MFSRGLYIEKYAIFGLKLANPGLYQVFCRQLQSFKGFVSIILSTNHELFYPTRLYFLVYLSKVSCRETQKCLVWLLKDYLRVFSYPSWYFSHIPNLGTKPPGWFDRCFNSHTSQGYIRSYYVSTSERTLYGKALPMPY